MPAQAGSDGPPIDPPAGRWVLVGGPFLRPTSHVAVPPGGPPTTTPGQSAGMSCPGTTCRLVDGGLLQATVRPKNFCATPHVSHPQCVRGQRRPLGPSTRGAEEPFATFLMAPPPLPSSPGRRRAIGSPAAPITVHWSLRGCHGRGRVARNEDVRPGVTAAKNDTGQKDGRRHSWWRMSPAIRVNRHGRRTWRRLRRNCPSRTAPRTHRRHVPFRPVSDEADATPAWPHSTHPGPRRRDAAASGLGAAGVFD